MQRRHFETIANAINTLPVDFETKKATARHFAKLLAETNPAFNNAMFTKAATGVILL